MKVFILEDNDERIKQFEDLLTPAGYYLTIAKSVAEAIQKYSPPYDILYLDHDLGGEVMVDSEKPNTGYQFAKWLVANDVDLIRRRIVLHSMNPAGVRNMKSQLPLSSVSEIPFSTLMKQMMDISEAVRNGGELLI